MIKEVIYTDRAPAPVGPYSQAIRVGPWVYIAGQIALNPDTQTMDNQSIEDETRRIMENIRAILEKAGGTLDHLVHVTIFMTDLSDFPTMNRVYSEYVGDKPPARATVQVASLPKNARVEITAVAWIPEQA